MSNRSSKNPLKIFHLWTALFLKQKKLKEKETESEIFLFTTQSPSELDSFTNETFKILDCTVYHKARTLEILVFNNQKTLQQSPKIPLWFPLKFGLFIEVFWSNFNMKYM